MLYVSYAKIQFAMSLQEILISSAFKSIPGLK